jgi:hypothetical protein
MAFSHDRIFPTGEKKSPLYTYSEFGKSAWERIIFFTFLGIQYFVQAIGIAVFTFKTRCEWKWKSSN